LPLAIIASICLALYKLALMVNFRLVVFPKLIRESSCILNANN